MPQLVAKTNTIHNMYLSKYILFHFKGPCIAPRPVLKGHVDLVVSKLGEVTSFDYSVGSTCSDSQCSHVQCVGIQQNGNLKYN
jgi:hypothetical protein